jgi:hypothetical protein
LRRTFSPLGIAPTATCSTDDVKDPDHYAKSYPGAEVFEIIKTVLTTHFSHLDEYDTYQMGNVLKYRLRAGFKDDGEDGAKDLRKALRCREMMSE